MMTATSKNPGGKIYPAAVIVPFDLSAAMKDDNWRECLRWPIAYPWLRDLQMSTATSILNLISGMPDPAIRRLALLVQSSLGSLIRMLGETALLAEATAETGIRFIGQSFEFDILSGTMQPSEAKAKPLSFKNEENIGFPLMRRFARVASWTKSPLRFIKAFVAPGHIAVSHNGLLRDAAENSVEVVSFQHADYLLKRGRRLAPEIGGEAAIRYVVEQFETLIDQTYSLSPHTLKRLGGLYWQQATEIVANAARDLEGLSRLPDVPHSLWAGSAGPHATRALMIEVRRRGGTTTGFDHGGSLSMIDDPDQTALREFAVADQYVVPTPACAEAIIKTGAVTRGNLLGSTQIVGRHGDPTFRVSLGRSSGRRIPRSKPRVYYLAAIFRGLRQHLPPYLPDPVYFDWQARLVQTVTQLDVDLICKPHPEGLLRGKRHPLERIGQVEYRNFEEVIDDADAYIFDVSQSTAFWEAVCTDRPVILIDLGHTRFNATVAPLIKRRCHVITAQWDERNLPRVDATELRDALLSQNRHIDPGEFRALLTAS